MAHRQKICQNAEDVSIRDASRSSGMNHPKSLLLVLLLVSAFALATSAAAATEADNLSQDANVDSLAVDPANPADALRSAPVLPVTTIDGTHEVDAGDRYRQSQPATRTRAASWQSLLPGSIQ